jgi:hypothetical protein
MPWRASITMKTKPATLNTIKCTRRLDFDLWIYLTHVAILPLESPNQGLLKDTKIIFIGEKLSEIKMIA